MYPFENVISVSSEFVCWRPGRWQRPKALIRRPSQGDVCVLGMDWGLGSGVLSLGWVLLRLCSNKCTLNTVAVRVRGFGW